jgi:hypothetical protein
MTHGARNWWRDDARLQKKSRFGSMRSMEGKRLDGMDRKTMDEMDRKHK